MKTLQLMFQEEHIADIYLQTEEGGGYCITGTKIINAEKCPGIILAKVDAPAYCKLYNWLLARLQHNIEAIFTHKLKNPIHEISRISAPEQQACNAICYGIALNDFWWVKLPQDTTTYADISLDKLSSNYEGAVYLNLLTGNTEAIEVLANKQWVKHEDDWYLYKWGCLMAAFHEVLALNLARYLGLETEDYTLHYHSLKVKNFTDRKTTYHESFSSYAAARSDLSPAHMQHQEILDILPTDSMKRDFNNMVLLDAIVSNTDRHMENYGVLHNLATGEIKLSPIYDLDHAFDLIENSPEEYLYELHKVLRKVPITTVRAFTSKFNVQMFDKIVKETWAIFEKEEEFLEEVTAMENYVNYLTVVFKEMEDFLAQNEQDQCCVLSF